MNLHPFNPLTDGTEFRAGGGFNYDEEKQNPGADSSTGASDTNKRKRTAAASSGRPACGASRTSSATCGTTACGGAACFASTTYGRTATSRGGPACGTRAAYGIAARSAAYGIATQRTFRTGCQPAFHAATDGLTAPSDAGRGQSRGSATTDPPAACLAATGPTHGPSTYQPAGAVTGSVEHAPTVACRAQSSSGRRS